MVQVIRIVMFCFILIFGPALSFGQVSEGRRILDSFLGKIGDTDGEVKQLDTPARYTAVRPGIELYESDDGLTARVDTENGQFFSYSPSDTYRRMAKEQTPSAELARTFVGMVSSEASLWPLHRSDKGSASERIYVFQPDLPGGYPNAGQIQATVVLWANGTLNMLIVGGLGRKAELPPTVLSETQAIAISHSRFPDDKSERRIHILYDDAGDRTLFAENRLRLTYQVDSDSGTLCLDAETGKEYALWRAKGQSDKPAPKTSPEKAPAPDGANRVAWIVGGLLLVGAAVYAVRWVRA